MPAVRPTPSAPVPEAGPSSDAVPDAPQGADAGASLPPQGVDDAPATGPYGVWRHLCADGCNCRPV